MDMKAWLETVLGEPVTVEYVNDDTADFEFRYARKGVTVYYGGSKRVLVGMEDTGVLLIEYPVLGWNGSEIPELPLDPDGKYWWTNPGECKPGDSAMPCPIVGGA